jgi:hypothetical protein
MWQVVSNKWSNICVPHGMFDIINLFNKWPNTCAPHGMFDMIDLSSPILVGHMTCLIWLTCLTNDPILVCHVACLIWLTCLTNGLILVWHVACLIWLICFDIWNYILLPHVIFVVMFCLINFSPICMIQIPNVYELFV